MPKQWSPEVIARAYELYVYQGKAPGEVQSILGVPASTFQTWKKDRKWDQAREKIAGSTRTIYEKATTILQDKLTELEATPTADIKPAQLDGILKLMKTVEAAKTHIPTIEAAVYAGEAFIEFIRQQIPDEETRKVVFDTWDQFLVSLRD